MILPALVGYRRPKRRPRGEDRRPREIDPDPRPDRPRHARRLRPLPRSRLRRLYLEADQCEDISDVGEAVFAP